jgi:hypothetical protein
MQKKYKGTFKLLRQARAAGGLIRSTDPFRHTDGLTLHEELAPASDNDVNLVTNQMIS